MPEYLNNVPTLNAYDPSCTLGPASNVAVINFSVLAQPALCQFWKPDPGSPGKGTWEQTERLFVANTYGAYAQRVGGVRFRSSITNTPAQIVAEMAFATDPVVLGGSLASVSVSGSGQVSPIAGAAQLDYAPFTAPAVVNTHSEGAASTVVDGNAVTYDGLTRVLIECFAPRVSGSGGGSTVTGVLLRDATVLGQWLMCESTIPFPQTHALFEETPPAGNHTYHWKAFSNAGAQTVDAGLGGSGQLLPGFLRVTSIT